MQNYLWHIWRVRHFWWHLSQSDLRARFRRSFFGIFWAIIQPFGLMVLISLVFSRMFNQSIYDYAPYILSGIIIWECITSVVIGGSLAFVQADAYIKQTKHPLAIYTLRNSVTSLAILMIASVTLFGWVIIALPQNIGICWLAVLTIIPILLLITWPLATLMAYIGVRFRDLPNALALILQAAWFVSPIYFRDSLFREGGLQGLVDYNPIYHILQIVRAPMLYGEWPTFDNYAWCLLTALVLFTVAAVMGRRMEPKVIFYL